MKKLIVFSFLALLLFTGVDCKDEPVQPPTNSDTTSHDYTWQIDTLGDASSVLYDVTIVNDSLAYAVGEVYKKDSAGNWDPNAYNLVKWNGIKWELLRIQFLSFCGNTSTGSYPTHAIISFNAVDYWITSGSQITNYDGSNQTPPICIPVSVIKLCGDSNQNIFGVGYEGNMFHYNGTTWQLLDSKTNTNIQDIYGVINKSTGQYEAYCAVTDFFQPKERKVLKITNTTQVDSIPWTPNTNVNSVWSNDGSFLYAGGDGLYENSSGIWKQIYYGASKYIQHIRGSGVNSIVVVGDAGLITHYNGSTWKTFPFDFNTAFNSVAVTNNMIVAVGTNGKAIIAIGRRK